MKILEIIWSIFLVIFDLSIMIWNIIEKSQIFIIILLAVMSIMAIFLLRKVLQEFCEERQQKK